MEIEEPITQIESMAEVPQVEAEAMEVDNDINMADAETIEATSEPEMQAEAQSEPDQQPKKPKKQEPNVTDPKNSSIFYELNTEFFSCF